MGSWSIDPVVSLVCRLSLALLLGSAAVHKLRDKAAFRAAIAGYALLPASWLLPTAALAIGTELGLGVSLLAPNISRFAALGSAMLLLVYTAAIAINVYRGRTGIDCGCSGPAGRVPVSGALIVRNSVLLVVVGLAALPTTARVLQAIDGITIAAAVTTFTLLYAGVDTALANDARWHRAATARIAPEMSL